MEEVPGILQLPNTPAAIIFAPLADSPVVPDAVIVCAKSVQLMLLTEAAGRAKSWSNLGMLFRPTCMGLPAALKHGTVASAGCIGNRVYTGIGDDESYMFVPGRDLEKVIDELDTIVEANARLSEFHRGRLESLTVS